MCTPFPPSQRAARALIYPAVHLRTAAHRELYNSTVVPIYELGKQHLTSITGTHITHAPRSLPPNQPRPALLDRPHGPLRNAQPGIEGAEVGVAQRRQRREPEVRVVRIGRAAGVLAEATDDVLRLIEEEGAGGCCADEALVAEDLFFVFSLSRVKRDVCLGGG